MNATAIPVQELTCQLLDAADGIPADTAATGLIISHGHFLYRQAFRRIITAGTSISTGQPLATISWQAALTALDTGLLPCASSEHAILRIAASLGDPAIPVHLRAVLGNLDTRNITPGRHRHHHRQRLTRPQPRPPHTATADACSFPGRPGPLIGCRTPVLAFERSAGRPGTPLQPADLVT